MVIIPSPKDFRRRPAFGPLDGIPPRSRALGAHCDHPWPPPPLSLLPPNPHCQSAAYRGSPLDPVKSSSVLPATTIQCARLCLFLLRSTESFCRKRTIRTYNSLNTSAHQDGQSRRRDHWRFRGNIVADHLIFAALLCYLRLRRSSVLRLTACSLLGNIFRHAG